MGRFTTVAAAVALGGVLFFSGSARAAVLFDNFFELPTSYNSNPAYARYAYSYSGFGYGTDGQQVAFAFTPTIDAKVDSILLPLDVFNDYGLRATVALYADNNGLPGATLSSQVLDVDLASGGQAGAPNTTPFFLANKPTVYAGEQYWVSVNVSNVDNTSVRWYASGSDYKEPTNDIPDYDYRGAFTNGSLGYQWQHTQGSYYRPAFFVSGTPVPEPATAAALLGTGVAFALRRRRQGN